MDRNFKPPFSPFFSPFLWIGILNQGGIASHGEPNASIAAAERDGSGLFPDGERHEIHMPAQKVEALHEGFDGVPFGFGLVKAITRSTRNTPAQTV